MSIITISRGSYSKGKAIAEGVAQRLGYSCVSRDDILEEVSRRWKIPEVKLVRAIHDAPSILERLGYGKEHYIAYVQAVLLTHLKRDDVVYHGLAGHFFVKGVSHVLKVRILADMEDRVRLEMERENIPQKEALQLLTRDDQERRKWSRHLYGIDTWDPSAYDLVLHIKKITIEDAVETICHLVGRPHFVSTQESRREVEDLALASEVKAALIGFRPDVEVQAEQGKVLVRTRASLSEEKRLTEEIRRMALGIPGVKEVQVKAHLTIEIP